MEGADKKTCLIGKNNYKALPKISINYINDKFEKNGIIINPIKVKHHKLDVLGYRIKNFTYITDANFISNSGIYLMILIRIII